MAAEEENILTSISGTSSEENPSLSATPTNSPPTNSKKPEARKTPTATISPIKVGMICITV